MKKQHRDLLLKQGYTRKEINKWSNVSREATRRLARENKIIEEKKITFSFYSSSSTLEQIIKKHNSIRVYSKDPAEIMILKEREEKLYKAISMLGDDDQEFITRLYWEEDRNIKGMADKLGISRDKVRWAHDRILKELKKFLEELNF